MSFTPQVITGTSADGEYVYYNATVVNNTVETDQRRLDPELVFQDTRQNPIIRDSAKYVMSVDQFALNGPQKNFPLWIPQIQPGVNLPNGNPDVDVTIYTVTFAVYLQGLTGGGKVNPAGGIVDGSWVSATLPISWIPENFLRVIAPRPSTATPRQAETEYYYGYSYDHFVYLLNNALTAAWRDVIFKASAAWSTLATPRGPPATTCPFFEFNAETGLFTICQDAQTSFLPYATEPRTTTQVYSAAAGISDALAPFTAFGRSNAANYQIGEFSYVGINANLEGLISNFDTAYFGYNNGTLNTTTGTIAQGYNYAEINSTTRTPNNVTWSALQTIYLPEFVFNMVPTPARPDSVFVLGPPYKDPANTVCPVYIRDTQNYKSTGTLWNPIASLVLVTGTLPVRFEYNASPLDIGTGNVGGTTQTSGSSQRVLIEVPFNCLTADQWRGFLLYKPDIPLFSALDPVHDGIQNIDVRVCWRSRLTNSLIPVKMYNSSSFTMRLRFVRKS